MITVITPPVAFVSLADAKAQVRFEATDRDPEIVEKIAAAIEDVDGPYGLLGRFVGRQTVEFQRADLCPPSIELPDLVNAAGSVVSVTYVDQNGADQLWTGFRVVELGQGRLGIAPLAGSDWPSVQAGFGAVRIRYLAGFDPVPIKIKQAVLLHVEILFDRPEGPALEALERARDRLLSPYRRLFA